MGKIKDTSIFKIDSNSILSDYGNYILTDLYLPIIGSESFSLYLFLVYKLKENKKTLSVEEILLGCNFNINSFLEGKKLLEGVGLIKTYEKEQDYLIVLYSTKSPKEYFKDIVLKGLLLQAIGKEKFEKILSKFSNKIDRAGYKEITSSFSDAFNVDLDNIDFSYNIENNDFLIDVKSKDPKFIFDTQYFMDLCEKDYKITKDDLNVSALKIIKKLSSLYSISEDNMAIKLSENINYLGEPGKRIDFKSLEESCYDDLIFVSVNKKKKKKTEKISSSTNIAKKIEIMENYSPLQYLSLKQGNTAVVRSDANLINFLSLKLGLENSVINALIDYVLEKNDNRLSENYVKKIGANLKRLDIKNAIDTMNYLEHSTSSSKTNSNQKIEETKKIEGTNNNVEEEFDPEVDEFLKELNDGI